MRLPTQCSPKEWHCRAGLSVPAGVGLTLAPMISNAMAKAIALAPHDAEKRLLCVNMSLLSPHFVDSVGSLSDSDSLWGGLQVLRLVKRA